MANVRKHDSPAYIGIEAVGQKLKKNIMAKGLAFAAKEVGLNL